jgi:hypothetical protein
LEDVYNIKEDFPIEKRAKNIQIDIENAIAIVEENL